MAEEKKTMPNSAFLTAFLMIILAAIALGIMYSLMIVNKEKLSIERANEINREDRLDIEL